FFMVVRPKVAEPAPRQSFPTRRSSDLRRRQVHREPEPLPGAGPARAAGGPARRRPVRPEHPDHGRPDEAPLDRDLDDRPAEGERSEEHTSELQSLAYLVCRLLLEKKNM